MIAKNLKTLKRFTLSQAKKNQKNIVAFFVKTR